MPTTTNIKKTHLFYFSSTGNSLTISRDLAKELRNTAIFSIPKVINKTIDLSAERIGLIFPIYFGGLPNIVKRFIEQLPPLTGKYLFLITNCKDKIYTGGPFYLVQKMFKKQRLKLSGGFYIQMVSNYIPMFSGLPKEKQEPIFKKEKLEIKKIAQIINSEKTHIEKSGLFMLDQIISIIQPIIATKLPNSDKNFWVDNNCIKCGTCEKICPVQNIKLENGKPTWLNHCESCLGCLQWCPTSAIQFGKNSKNRRRYRNPEVSLKDFL